MDKAHRAASTIIAEKYPFWIRKGSRACYLDSIVKPADSPESAPPVALPVRSATAPPERAGWK